MPVRERSQPGRERGVLRRRDDEEGVRDVFIPQILRIEDSPHLRAGFFERGALLDRFAVVGRADDDARATFEIQAYREKCFTQISSPPGGGRTR